MAAPVVKPPTAARIRAVDRRLVEVYGDPSRRPSGDPLAGMVATILSQHTSDTNSHRAFASLRERFRTWDEVVTASPREVAEAIRCGGLADQKAPRIQRVLQEVRARTGEYGLDGLADLDNAAAIAFLTSFNGVGPKTAACVLLFDCGRDVFPVDTHVHRITQRLGWMPAAATAEQTFATLDAAIPAGIKYRMHVNLIAHGRRRCHARNPECSSCCLRTLCAYAGSTRRR